MSLRKTLTLRPYGSNLITPPTAIWIAFMSILALSMATVEGIVWGVTSKLILSTDIVILPVGIGLLVALFIWIFDVSLITLDVSEEALNARVAKKVQSNKSSKIGRRHILGWGVLIRLIVVTISVFVTAPMLGQIFLDDEIIARIQSHNSAELSKLRTNIDTLFERNLEKLKIQRFELGEQLSDEIAGGKLGSGRYGDGPVANSIRERIKTVGSDIDKLNDSHSKVIYDLENSTAAKLSEKYRLNFLIDSFETRNKIHNDIKDEHNLLPKSELLAYIFLGLIFLVMAVLKLFQGEGITLYYNESIQDKYIRYLHGYYNTHLLENEQPNGKCHLTPLQFKNWVREHPKEIAASAQELYSQNERDNLKQSLKEQETLVSSSKKELEECEKKLETVRLNSEANIQKKKKLKDSIDKTQKKIDNIKVKLHDLTQNLYDYESTYDASAMGKLTKDKARFQRELEEYEKTKKHIDENILQDQRRFKNARADVSEADVQYKNLVKTKNEILNTLAEQNKKDADESSDKLDNNRNPDNDVPGFEQREHMYSNSKQNKKDVEKSTDKLDDNRNSDNDVPDVDQRKEIYSIPEHPPHRDSLQ